jgi:hypothetical protein
LSIFCKKKYFFSGVSKNFFVLFCTELRDLYATYTDFENASWRWPTNNFQKVKKRKKMAISNCWALYETTFTLKPIVGHIFRISLISRCTFKKRERNSTQDKPKYSENIFFIPRLFFPHFGRFGRYFGRS